MLLILLAGSLLVFSRPIVTQFNMYPNISSTLLTASLNISSNCLAALNTTVDCDQNLFQMAGNADGYFWADDNATALCAFECLSSASSWWSQCANACEDDQLNAYGRLYPAETVPGRFLDGLNVVCLTANTDISQDVGINGTIISFTDIGGENSTVNGTGLTEDTPLERRQTSASSYCLVQSYYWVGSDIIRLDCDDPANANQSQCIDPTDVSADNSRIANLYPDTLLCSECFLKMFYLRLASPFLPDLDQSDFMVNQWFDILDICNANSTMPELLVRTLPSYEAAPGFSIDGSSNSTESLTDPLPLGNNETYNSTCSERVITFANLVVPSIDYSTQTPCDVIPPYLEASTGDVQQMMGTPGCVPDFNTTDIPSVCAPLPCEVVPMTANITCDEFAQSISNSTAHNPVTVTQFLSWNPNLIGLCTSTTSQYVCVGAPGGTYVPPPVSNATTSAGSQQRGGGDGSGSGTGSGGVDGSGRNSTILQPGQKPPSPTQSGIPAACTKFAEAQSGDGCDSFSSLFDITLQMLVAWNPVLGADGAKCQTEFWAGDYYCVGVSGSSTTTSIPVITPTALATPSPVQSGIDPQCTKYAEAPPGSYCTGFATNNSITPAQLYAWNPILGANGADCGTEMFADYYYCVGAPAGTQMSTTTTTTSGAAPGPTQSGITSACNKYAEAVSGDGCGTFAQEHGITTAELYAWNTVLGSGGSNCATGLWVGEYYCVGVSS